jgi:hypothetical protein
MIAYVVAAFAMAFSATSALTLITMVNHFDPPVERSPETMQTKAA